MRDAYQVVRILGSDPWIESYRAFIASNWISTLRETNDWFGLIDKKTFYEVYRRAISGALAKPTTQVALALLADDSDVCLGWAVYEGETLHYVYVKRAMRRQGIARSLVPKTTKTITHLTVPGVVIWKNKFPAAIFNPFVL